MLPLFLRKRVKHLQNRRLIIAHCSFSIIPVDNLATISFNSSIQRRVRVEENVGRRRSNSHAWASQECKTYHGSLEALGILLELLHSLIHGRCATDNSARVAHIVEYRPELVWCGRLLCDVEVELCPLELCLCSVIASLVLGRCLAGIGRHLLQEGQDLGRGRGAGLVEEGDDVFGFALRNVSFEAIYQRAIEMSDPIDKNLQSRTCLRVCGLVVENTLLGLGGVWVTVARTFGVGC